MLGKVIATELVKVKAGQKSSEIIDSVRHRANGACIVRISGAGVDAKTMLLR
jgi:hypothetical protein